MSDYNDNEASPRFSFGTARIEESNQDYGDEAAQEFALLNGVAPRDGGRMVKIPRATLELRFAFPATAKFEEITRYVERTRRLLQAESRALWSAGVEAE